MARVIVSGRGSTRERKVAGGLPDPDTVHKETQARARAMRKTLTAGGVRQGPTVLPRLDFATLDITQSLKHLIGHIRARRAVLSSSERDATRDIAQLARETYLKAIEEANPRLDCSLPLPARSASGSTQRPAHEVHALLSSDTAPKKSLKDLLLGK